MSDIELVIKIPEEDWKSLKESDGCRWSRAIIEGVINGTPLPKRSESINDFDIRKFIEEHYEPVEDKPGYVWFNKRNLQMISIDTLAECLEKGRRRTQKILSIPSKYGG